MPRLYRRKNFCSVASPSLLASSRHSLAYLGIVTAHFDITLVSSLNQNYRTMALEPALTWIFLGSVLAYQVVKPFHRITRLVIQTLLFLIAFVEAIEFVLNIQGSHFFIETLLVSLGSTIIGPSSAPISPAVCRTHCSHGNRTDISHMGF